jgi:hypothetical protein
MMGRQPGGGNGSGSVDRLGPLEPGVTVGVGVGASSARLLSPSASLFGRALTEVLFVDTAILKFSVTSSKPVTARLVHRHGREQTKMSTYEMFSHSYERGF